jgi:NADP-dependent 3-hydroxy acid dehydrogenase YdfG
MAAQPDEPTRSIAVVTGASRGFGLAIATHLTSLGVAVIGIARDREALSRAQELLGENFVAVVADVRDPDLAAGILTHYRPTIVVLNAGATPRAARIHEQTWESFGANWETDVRHVFEFTRAALRAPLAPGSSVIAVSSGAAVQGSPLSGGYAGAKSTIRFISSYAAADSERLRLGIRFTAVLPKLTPATGLGATFVDGYASYGGVDRETYLSQLGATLTAEQVAQAVADLALDARNTAAAYLLTSDGLRELS